MPGQRRGKPLNRLQAENVRALVESPAVLRNDLQPRFERMIVGVGDVETEHGRSRLQERIPRRVIAGLHDDAARTETAEPVADEYHGFRARQRPERVAEEPQRGLDRVRSLRLVLRDSFGERRRFGRHLRRSAAE